MSLSDRARSALARIGRDLGPACGSCGAPVGASEHVVTVRTSPMAITRWPCCDTCWTTPALVTHLQLAAAYEPRRAGGPDNGSSEVVMTRQAETHSWFNLDARRGAAVLEAILGKPVPLDAALAATVLDSRDAPSLYVGKLSYYETGWPVGSSAQSEAPFAFVGEALVTAYAQAVHFTTATLACFADGQGCALCGRTEFPRSWGVHDRYGSLYCQVCADAVDDAGLYGPRGGMVSALDYALSEHVGYDVKAADYGVRPASEGGHKAREPWSHVDVDLIRQDVADRAAAEAAKTARPSAVKVGA